jgi:multiple sugar transport system permease protein
MSRHIRTAVVVLLSALWLLPIYLLLMNATRSTTGFSLTTLWNPSDGASFFSNISTAFQTQGFGASNAINTVVYSLLAPAIAVLIAALAGYGIVVLRVRFGGAWFVIIFGATILPLQMLAAPLFLGYGRTHLYDTRYGMILVYTAICIPFAMFVMRNFFNEVARSVYEAAQIDGSSSLRTFVQIYVPMSWSALVAVFVLQFTFVWNDLFVGLSLATSQGAQGVTPALAGLQSSYGGASYPVVLSAAVAVTLPTVLLFLFTQRFFSAGLSLGK